MKMRTAIAVKTWNRRSRLTGRARTPRSIIAFNYWMRSPLSRNTFFTGLPHGLPECQGPESGHVEPADRGKESKYSPMLPCFHEFCEPLRPRIVRLEE